MLLIELAPHEVEPLALLFEGPFAGGQRLLFRRMLRQPLVEQRAIAFEGLSEPGCRGLCGSKRRLLVLESRLLLLEFREPRFDLAVLPPQGGQAAAEIGLGVFDLAQPFVELFASGVVLLPPAGQVGLLRRELFRTIRQLACRLGQRGLVRGHLLGPLGEVRLEPREFGRPGGQLFGLLLDVAPVRLEGGRLRLHAFSLAGEFPLIRLESFFTRCQRSDDLIELLLLVRELTSLQLERRPVLGERCGRLVEFLAIGGNCRSLRFVTLPRRRQFRRGLLQALAIRGELFLVLLSRDLRLGQSSLALGQPIVVLSQCLRSRLQLGRLCKLAIRLLYQGGPSPLEFGGMPMEQLEHFRNGCVFGLHRLLSRREIGFAARVLVATRLERGGVPGQLSLSLCQLLREPLLLPGLGLVRTLALLERGTIGLRGVSIGLVLLTCLSERCPIGFDLPPLLGQLGPVSVEPTSRRCQCVPVMVKGRPLARGRFVVQTDPLGLGLEPG